MKLLFICADLQFYNRVQTKLAAHGYEITLLQSPKNLFQELDVVKPDLLVIDFLLGDINGGTICHELKCNPKTHDLPVVILSDYSGLERFSSKFGCDHIFNKQTDSEELADRIASVPIRRLHSFVA